MMVVIPCQYLMYAAVILRALAFKRSFPAELPEEEDDEEDEHKEKKEAKPSRFRKAGKHDIMQLMMCSGSRMQACL